jgi:hypothetical protein
MKYAMEITSRSMIYMPNFKEISIGVQNLLVGIHI